MSILAVLLVAPLLGAVQPAAPTPPTPTTPSEGVEAGLSVPAGGAGVDVVIDSTARDLAGLENVARFSPVIINGSVPDGADGFDTLASLGVKTIVCVDGARPDVESARARGMRYVHVPIGYDGVTPAERRAFDVIALTLDGPIYVHCYHGRHRSPAIASLMTIARGESTPETCRARMEAIGTSPKYDGLYRVVSGARPVSIGSVDASGVRLPEVAEVDGLQGAMAMVARSFDALELVREAGWEQPEEHPDIHPEHEGAIMGELFVSLIQAEGLEGQRDGYARLMRRAREQAHFLSEAIRSGDKTGAEGAFGVLSASCSACHRAYRD